MLCLGIVLEQCTETFATPGSPQKSLETKTSFTGMKYKLVSTD